MTIVKTNFPSSSILTNNHKKYNYFDSFQGTLFDGEHKFKPIDVVKAFFSTGPTWVGKLFNLRNKIVSIFGLKTSGKLVDRKMQLDNLKCEPGEQLGLFRVFNSTDKEIVLGEDDKHLNFRVSLYLEQSLTDQLRKDLTISTTVEFNNWFGRLYFLIVKPFHQIIVPYMMKGIIKELEKQNRTESGK